MKKIFIKGILLLALSSIFYLGFCFAINKVQISGKRVACWFNPFFQRKGGQEYRIVRDWQPEKNYDIVVLGSSHAYRGYDPREFESAGFSLYAAGSGFQNTLATYVLANNVFKPKNNPLIIVDLFDQTFTDDGMGSFTRLIENLPDDHSAWQLVSRQPDIRSFNSYMCRLFSKQIAPEVPDEQGYLRDGYCPKLDTMTVLPPAMSGDKEFNTQFIKYLDRLLEYFDNNKIRYVLVSHPQPKVAGYDVFHEQFRNQITSIISRHKVQYLDYNSNHDLDNFKHFADANHLNQAGVSIFNQRLIEDMKANQLMD
jgi:hypothetical protein